MTSPNNGTMRVTELGAVNWNNTDGTRISNNNVLYFMRWMEEEFLWFYFTK